MVRFFSPFSLLILFEDGFDGLKTVFFAFFLRCLGSQSFCIGQLDSVFPITFQHSAQLAKHLQFLSRAFTGQTMPCVEPQLVVRYWQCRTGLMAQQ